MELAVSLLQKYIRHRQRNIKEQERIKHNPELYADVIWADEKIALLKAEIAQIQTALDVLTEAKK